MKPLERFQEVREKRHQYAEEWKQRTGGKVFGYFCIYVPEEIMYAAGILPVRIYGNPEPSHLAETFITSQWCPFSRSCLAQGLLGRYDYLDGLVSCYTCHHILQTYDIWQRHRPTPFKHYLWTPQCVDSRWAEGCFASMIETFKQAIEEWTGHPISAQGLDQAIEVYNTNRSLLTQLYELRKIPAPPISGAEAMEIVLASTIMDKEEHNQLLRELLRELRNQRGEEDGRVRLMFVGSENDDTEFLRFIE